MFYTEIKEIFMLVAVGMLSKKEEGEDARGTSGGDSYKVTALANIFRASNHVVISEDGATRSCWQQNKEYGDVRSVNNL